MMMGRVSRAGLLAHIKNMTTTLTGASILSSVGGRLNARRRVGAMCWRIIMLEICPMALKKASAWACSNGHFHGQCTACGCVVPK